MTARFLRKDGVPFKLVIEPQEEQAYAKEFSEHLIILPFSNLGMGGIPARNFVWDHAQKSGSGRHWILDDNIAGIWRRYAARRIRCESGPAFRACEEFTDRYENIAISGMNYYMFSIDGQKQPAFNLNVHVYSCLLIDNSIPFRWRGRYNEDTDLCLRVLSAGYCTVLFNAFLAWKMTTMTMKGGNSDSLYKGDGRLRMARSLERVWPYVVETRRRFRRPQHYVRDSWAKFDTPLKLKKGVDLSSLPDVDEFGLELNQVKDGIKSKAVVGLLEDYKAGRKFKKV